MCKQYDITIVKKDIRLDSNAVSAKKRKVLQVLQVVMRLGPSQRTWQQSQNTHTHNKYSNEIIRQRK